VGGWEGENHKKHEHFSRSGEEKKGEEERRREKKKGEEKERREEKMGEERREDGRREKRREGRRVKRREEGRREKRRRENSTEMRKWFEDRGEDSPDATSGQVQCTVPLSYHSLRTTLNTAAEESTTVEGCDRIAS
jgi:hypothetical protein